MEIAFAGLHEGKALSGIRFRVIDRKTFRPVLTAVTVLATVQKLYGIESVWEVEGTRPEFFDQLMGTDRVRRGLQKGISAFDITVRWARDLARFKKKREEFLLYKSGH